MPEHTFDPASLIPGYFDDAGLFVAMPSDAFGNRYWDGAKATSKPVFRGPIISGPVDGVTADRYLYPDAASLVQNTHIFIEKVTVLSGVGVAGDTPTLALQLDNTTPAIVTATVRRDQPGTPATASTMPAYWYLVLDPRGSGEGMVPQEVLKFSISQTLPFVTALIPGGPITGGGGGAS